MLYLRIKLLLYISGKIINYLSILAWCAILECKVYLHIEKWGKFDIPCSKQTNLRGFGVLTTIKDKQMVKKLKGIYHNLINPFDLDFQLGKKI